MVIAYIIISEIGPLKEEAGMGQGLMARHYERRAVGLRG
jgi:hypothetical protein